MEGDEVPLLRHLLSSPGGLLRRRRVLQLALELHGVRPEHLFMSRWVSDARKSVSKA